MTAKEYREKEQITDANFWDGDEIDFNMVYEFAEEYHREQLRLHNVSNRRELLIAFFNHIHVEEIVKDVPMKIEPIVDEWLKSN